MNELIGFIAQQLVDYPDEVKVNLVESSNTSVFELRVAKEDVGKVIGRSGRTAQAIRHLLSAVSAKERKRAILEILE
jgi:predicted RNA-binding protein YlqC (UPF0109 family)